jgi:hypothetical protein
MEMYLHEFFPQRFVETYCEMHVLSPVFLAKGSQ